MTFTFLILTLVTSVLSGFVMGYFIFRKNIHNIRAHIEHITTDTRIISRQVAEDRARINSMSNVAGFSFTITPRPIAEDNREALGARVDYSGIVGSAGAEVVTKATEPKPELPKPERKPRRRFQLQ
jgi:hypothetical protein